MAAIPLHPVTSQITAGQKDHSRPGLVFSQHPHCWLETWRGQLDVFVEYDNSFTLFLTFHLRGCSYITYQWTTNGHFLKRWHNHQDDIKMFDVIYAQPKPLHSCPHITILVGWIPSVHWGLCPVFTIPQSAAVGYQISPNICVRVQQSLELTPASLDPEHSRQHEG